MPRRHIVFATGTRADLGLMVRTLGAIQRHPRLRLSIIATGMHLDPAYGRKLSALTAAGLEVTATVPWEHGLESPAQVAAEAGRAQARFAQLFAGMKADGVLLVGDRVEALSAGVAAHLSRLPLAHVHGGDRAEGQTDDAVRHALTKLASLHLAATDDSARRILRLGERPESVHIVGAPGVENIRREAAKSHYLADIAHKALVLLHPTSTEPLAEYVRAKNLLAALGRCSLPFVLMLPNNDPGATGIAQAWREAARTEVIANLPRSQFLALLRDCRMLVGNSSSGIIEAASFGTRVLDIGPRQSGRLAGGNVVHVSHTTGEIVKSLGKLLRLPAKGAAVNPYSRPNTARECARLLASPAFAGPVAPKLISY